MDGFGLRKNYGSLVGLVQKKIKRYNSAQDLNATEIKQSLEELSVCILQLLKKGMQTQASQANIRGQLLQIVKKQRQFSEEANIRLGETKRELKQEINKMGKEVEKISENLMSQSKQFATNIEETFKGIQQKIKNQQEGQEMFKNDLLRKQQILEREIEQLRIVKIGKSSLLNTLKEEEEKQIQRQKERQKQRQVERQKKRQEQIQRQMQRSALENDFLEKSGKSSWNDLQNITSLDLSGKNIKELPEKLGTLKQLIVLYLHQNQLTELPQSLGNLKELQTLYLTNNQLTKLPDSLGNLSKLQQLYIYNNRNLKELPKSFKNLKELIWLCIDWQLLPRQNIFKTEPFTSLKNLQKFYIWNDDRNQQRREAIKKECEQNKIKVYFW